MDINVLDTKFDTQAVVDTYTSFIWTDRYRECGDFELYVPASKEMSNILVKDRYLSIASSDRTMIIEETGIKTNYMNGDWLIVTGRSLESILARRIIMQKTVLTGSFQDGIQKLLNENVISPTDSKRKIGNFTFTASTDPTITALTIDASYFGDNLYDVIVSQCAEKDVGFKIILTPDNKFNFTLYAGTDYSYDQTSKPWVVFSPDYDNLIGSDYKSSNVSLRTAVLASYERSSDEAVYTNIVEGEETGLARREGYVSASIESWENPNPEYDEDGNEIEDPTAEMQYYTDQLKSTAKEALSEAQVTTAFSGEVDNSVQFTYGDDYVLGDIVQVANEYGMQHTSRVSEVMFSSSENGERAIPTFTVKDDSASGSTTSTSGYTPGTGGSSGGGGSTPGPAGPQGPKGDKGDPGDGGGNIYSTEEQRIGTWIDGKPLYRRVFEGTTGPDVGQHEVLHQVMDKSVVEVRRIDGLIVDINNAIEHLGYFVENQNGKYWFNLLYFVGNIYDNVSGTDFFNRPFIAFIEYTKTTDQATSALTFSETMDFQTAVSANPVSQSVT